jgi:hypothetical protein
MMASVGVRCRYPAADARSRSHLAAACRLFDAIRRPAIDGGATRAHRCDVGGLHGPEPRKLDMVTFILWCLLFVMCWPLALLALVLYPVVWLLSLPFRLVGISVSAVFALLAALLFLPARALGQRR